ncbi:hypothetical protein NHL50_02065 [Acidimicrobiia bacterium EGI L10123]|uniref:hypothetical protein n=1 Tax=Salinilacustrithrix flava TaxID=2957203 RepID=UPI003D7C1DCD|nr:hypothetical protein [Acidimicrobiia bacterium EGI L10123]
MNIYQRVITFQGPMDEVVPWAVEMTALVNDKTDLDVSLWQGLFGGPLGTMAWSTQVSGLAAVGAASDALAQDKSYLKAAEKARDWIAMPGEDHFMRVQHVAGGGYTRPDVGAYAEVTNAAPAEGKIGEAIQWSVEIADLHAEITHQTVLFGSVDYGEYGMVGWMGMSDDADGIDRGAEAIASDDRYLKSVDGAGGLFRPGSATRRLARRIA